MGGFLGFWGLDSWYLSLPKDVQAAIYTCADCPGEHGFKAEWLMNGDHHPLSGTPCQFLCNLAMNAVQSRQHDIADLLMEKAALVIASPKDLDYFKAIEANLADLKTIHPDQEQIDSLKPTIYSLIQDNPGILQSEIKRQFQADMENAVGLAYWALYQAGQVRREKHGRTFKVYVI